MRIASERVAKTDKEERKRIWREGDYQRQYASEPVEPIQCNDKSYRGSLSYGHWSVYFAVDPDKSLDYAMARDALAELRLEKWALLHKYAQEDQ